MTGFLPYGRQSISEDDIDAVVEVLRGDFLTQGQAVPRFEAALAERVGAKHAVAVSNGTAALHIACLAAGLKPGETGLTQAITFAASANAIAYCGAQAGLTDVAPDTLGMSPETLRTALEGGAAPRVVIPVAYAGLSTLTSNLRSAAGDAVIIEDACHALGGARADGGAVGGGALADMSCFSFHPVKQITTGEGGAVTTDDDELARRLRLLRSHGIEREAARFTGAERGPWVYEQQSIGFNYRLTDIQAALGVSQLARLDGFVARRRRIAALYDEALGNLEPVRPIQAAPELRARSAHHLYVVQIDYAALGTTRAEVMTAMREAGVGTQVHYIPVYKQPFHRPAHPDAEARFPAAEAFYRSALTLPCFPDMADSDVECAIAALKGALGLPA